ncbi:low temperature requirement protein A [Pediococcus acidilactici]|nr:low temperature requirement protein A [Pediococcus acidilactici]
MISWIAPSFTGKLTVHRPIIFSHLLERVTALIIIMFGEMIVGIAEYFTQRTVSPYSLLLFVLVALLFMTYATEFSDLIEEKQGRETGNRLIYLHYFILFGLSLITVAIKFIHSTNANLIFSVGCLYTGLLLFYVGILLGGIYNEVSFKIGSRRVCWIIGFTLLGWGGTLQLKNSTEIIFITVVVALLNLLILARIGQNGTSRQKIQ